MKKQPRGIRNNNPGNIEYSAKNPWQGLDDPPHDGRFCRFVDPCYGIRAIARTLITYQDKRKADDGSRIDTVREIIDRWAPPHENDTSAYVAAVRSRMGLDGHEKDGEVDVHRFEDCKALVEAIIKHENGIQPYTDAQIERGLRLAGVEPEQPKSLQASRTIQGGQVAAASTAATAGMIDYAKDAASSVQSMAESLAPTIPVIEKVAPYVVKVVSFSPYIFAALAATGIGYMIWARIDDRRRGLR